MRISWVHPDVAAAVRAALLDGRRSLEEAFVGEADTLVVPHAAPASVTPAAWPALAEHVARAERVREVVIQAGLPAAWARFGASSHAVELAALLEAATADGAPELAAADELAQVRGLLGCAIDQQLAYGHFLSRLVELAAASDPDGTVAAFERFVTEARALPAEEPSWPERLRVAEDGLASLYVRTGRTDAAETLFAARFAGEPQDTTVAITAARAFLEHGDVAHAVSWLERGAARAAAAGRRELADTLTSKARSLRARLS